MSFLSCTTVLQNKTKQKKDTHPQKKLLTVGWNFSWSVSRLLTDYSYISGRCASHVKEKPSGMNGDEWIMKTYWPLLDFIKGIEKGLRENELEFKWRKQESRFGSSFFFTPPRTSVHTRLDGIQFLPLDYRKKRMLEIKNDQLLFKTDLSSDWL